MSDLGDVITPVGREKRRQAPVSAPVSDDFDPGPAQALLAKHAVVQYPYRCTFGGVPLIIDEGVFCPTFTKASPFLLRALSFRPSMRVLDVFAGCGAFGIIAATYGARVVTVDISPAAVSCTKKNAALNNVQTRVDARLGTMQECLAPSETFDLIIANPPLLPGEPSGLLGAAVFDRDLRATAELIASLPRHLSSNGRCLLLTSDVSERHGFDVQRQCATLGLVEMIIEKRDVGYECYRVHQIERAHLIH